LEEAVIVQKSVGDAAALKRGTAFVFFPNNAIENADALPD
jgi:hypothetical protein